MSVEVALDALRGELEQLQARAEQIAAAVQLLQPLTDEQLTHLTTGRAPHQPHAAIAALRADGQFAERLDNHLADPVVAKLTPDAAAPADPPACSLCSEPSTCRTVAHGPLCDECSGGVPAPEAPRTPPAPRREAPTGQGRDGLTEKEQRVLSYINAEGTTSKAAIAKALIEHVAPAYVTQVLSRLVDRGLITVTGATSGRRFHSLSPRSEDRAKPKQGPGAAAAAVENAGVLRCKILDLVKRDPGLSENQIRHALPPSHDANAVTAALVKLRGDGKLTLSMGAYRLSAAERGAKSTLGSGVRA